MFNFSLSEIAVILALALIVLGPKRIPEVARQLGQIVRKLRRAGNDLRENLETQIGEPLSFDQHREHHHLTTPRAKTPPDETPEKPA